MQQFEEASVDVDGIGPRAADRCWRHRSQCNQLPVDDVFVQTVQQTRAKVANRSRRIGHHDIKALVRPPTNALRIDTCECVLLGRVRQAAVTSAFESRSGETRCLISKDGRRLSVPLASSRQHQVDQQCQPGHIEFHYI